MAAPRTSFATHLRSVSEHTCVGAYAFVRLRELSPTLNQAHATAQRFSVVHLLDVATGHAVRLFCQGGSLGRREMLGVQSKYLPQFAEKLMRRWAQSTLLHDECVLAAGCR